MNSPVSMPVTRVSFEREEHSILPGLSNEEFYRSYLAGYKMVPDVSSTEISDQLECLKEEFFSNPKKRNKESGDLIKWALAEKAAQEQFLKTEFNMGMDEANAKMKALREKAIKLLPLPETRDAADRIPHITHKVWLTNPTDPYDVPRKVIRGLKQTYLNLPDYKHFFWTNCPEKLAGTFATLKRAGIKLEVHHTDELLSEPGRRVFDAYMNQNLFAFACDVVRLQIVHKIGGIYSDIGWTLRSNTSRLIQNFDYVMHGNYFQAHFAAVCHAVVAANPGAKILGSICSMLDDKELLSRHMANDQLSQKFACNTELYQTIVVLTWPLVITTFFAALSDPDTRLLLLLDGARTFRHLSCRSWSQKGRFGAKTWGDCDRARIYADVWKGITN
ncbi:MAG: glycosyltransferase [Alphaproteobacteria bacterium]|nr:glycosyltransferase [Alphaproteobacteria bacterium]